MKLDRAKILLRSGSGFPAFGEEDVVDNKEWDSEVLR